ncbi:glycosyltransferase [Kangiella shandongensis]|uniref:glycosyltransferase n=1 Tax=Kangiella shandongensis TaxID=2763258 RepID=UPI001CC1A814|nr:glycosyltransferase [Kangiella shandongensis]
MNNNDKNSVNLPVDEYKELINQHLALKAQVKELRSSVSYRLGSALIGALKSWRSALILPKTIYEIYVDVRDKKGSKSVYNSYLFRAPIREGLAAPKHNIAQKNLPKIEKLFGDRVKGRKLRIAAIMDDFSLNCFSPDCDILEVTPSGYKRELEAFKPDFLFIESAWLGKDKLWSKKVSNCSLEVVGCIDWCFENNTPTIFWNKEDPLHHNTFLPIAKHVDYVFTTDIDSISKYQESLGHKRVYTLPFAAQPKYHNPIEKYERKDRFCFAGSYYTRFPERKVDLSRLLRLAKSYKGIDIYDRNHKKPHPHYNFPVEFENYILGGLSFSEIDKAYKGYRYGININTIKQSQSMFARRVFELLASNTITVSNYSRGMRLLFGDLVLASDNPKTLIDKLDDTLASELFYKKYRLQGLRKVLSQHTYSNRLDYIRSKLSGTTLKERVRGIHIFALANNNKELDSIVKSFKRQNHKSKFLYVNSPLDKPEEFNSNIIYYNSREAWLSKYKSLKGTDVCAFFSPSAYYGKNYLTDLYLALSYSEVPVITKATYYEYNDNGFQLIENGNEYRYVDKASVFSTLVEKDRLDLSAITQLWKSQARQYIAVKALSIDAFNYCEVQVDDQVDYSLVNDLNSLDLGLDSIYQYELSENIGDFSAQTTSDGNIISISAKELYEIVPEDTEGLYFKIEDGKLLVKSNKPAQEFSAIYFNKKYSREDVNLLFNNQYFVESGITFEGAFILFGYYDKNHNKLSTSEDPVNGSFNALDIPFNCRYIKVGIKLKGAGELALNQILVGEMFEVPTAITGKSENLVVTPQYPAYDNLYRFGFLHSRVKAYKKAGMSVDVFRVTEESCKPFREFEDIDVSEGSLKLLERTLSSGCYKNIIVHFLNDKIWSVLEKYLENTKITVWTHGADIQYWKRRAVQFDSSIERAVLKKVGINTKAFWEKILNNSHPNLKIVFVSEYFRNEVFEDYDVSIPNGQVRVIHNFINTKLFNFSKKNPEQRKKILSIRPYANAIYANDLTVKAILELAKRPFFNDLEFCLVGDGPQFESLTQPLKDFENVILRKGFLTHEEIAKVHKDYGVFLCPTRMDTQGVSRGEAMSSGLVPITTRIAAVPEFVDEMSGLLTEPEDHIALANAIEKIYRDPELFESLSRNASERAEIQCGYDSTIDREINLLKE